MTRVVHYVGFRGDEYVRAYRIWGGPVMIHKVYDKRVFTEVGEEDIVIFGPQYKYSHYVWDASRRYVVGIFYYWNGSFYRCSYVHGLE